MPIRGDNTELIYDEQRKSKVLTKDQAGIKIKVN